mmetsp:Transcript_16182/g.21173  ORF Transcript_16182/g.21173 Transcript_16182/m.21173 type:complete len:96 (+) Transcript_16182:253-540(+)
MPSDKVLMLLCIFLLCDRAVVSQDNNGAEIQGWFVAHSSVSAIFRAIEERGLEGAVAEIGLYHNPLFVPWQISNPSGSTCQRGKDISCNWIRCLR